MRGWMWHREPVLNPERLLGRNRNADQKEKTSRAGKVSEVILKFSGHGSSLMTRSTAKSRIDTIGESSTQLQHLTADYWFSINLQQNVRQPRAGPTRRQR